MNTPPTAAHVMTAPYCAVTRGQTMSSPAPIANPTSTAPGPTSSQNEPGRGGRSASRYSGSRSCMGAFGVGTLYTRDAVKSTVTQVARDLRARARQTGARPRRGRATWGSTNSVTIVVGLVRPVHGNADVVSLFL